MRGGKVASVVVCFAVFGIPSYLMGQACEGLKIRGVEMASQEDGEANHKTLVALIVGCGFRPADAAPNVLLVSGDGDFADGTVAPGESDTQLVATFTVAEIFEPDVLRVKAGEASDSFLVAEEEEREERPPWYDDINLWRTVMDPRNVSDIFGKRISKQFIVLQVTIRNKSRDNAFLIHDLSLDLTDVYLDEELRNFESELYVSSIELSILRGVAEHGRTYDKRNLLLRMLHGVAAIAGGLVGVAGFGPSYADGVAVLGGPVSSAYEAVFPDHSNNQMTRLNDSAYIANTVIPKEQAKVAVVFLPQRMYLTPKQRKRFWKDPTSLHEDCEDLPCVDLRKIRVFVQGIQITDVAGVPPVVTQVSVNTFLEGQFELDEAVIEGTVVGRFLAGAKIGLGKPKIEGVEVDLAGTPTAGRLPFVFRTSRPVPTGTQIELVVSKDQDFQTFQYRVEYEPRTPTIEEIEFEEADLGKFGEAGAEITVSLIGNDLAGEPEFVEGTAPGLEIRKVTDESTLERMKLIVTVNEPLTEAAAIGIRVRTVNGLISAIETLNISVRGNDSGAGVEEGEQ